MLHPAFKLIASLSLGTALALCPACSTRASAEHSRAQAARSAESVTLRIEGMTCASCSLATRAALMRLDGVRDVRVSVVEKRAVVDYEASKVTPQQLVEAVHRLGYRARVESNAS